MTNLKLAPHAKYAKTISKISGASVHQAIEDILSTDVKGTAANGSYVMEQTYSYEHLLWLFGSFRDAGKSKEICKAM